jgi:hypothetical protein
MPPTLAKSPPIPIELPERAISRTVVPGPPPLTCEVQGRRAPVVSFTAAALPRSAPPTEVKKPPRYTVEPETAMV